MLRNPAKHTSKVSITQLCCGTTVHTEVGQSWVAGVYQSAEHVAATSVNHTSVMLHFLQVKRKQKSITRRTT